mgnify:CR=1 FL=1
MSTISVPLTSEQEERLQNLIRNGYGANKAEAIRRAILRASEEEAIGAVISAEQEIKEGKIVRGDLKKILKKI